MTQEETRENNNPNESASDSPKENLISGESGRDSTMPDNLEEIDNLPIESIGSYARLEQLLTDEEKENTTNPTAQS
jgi:hypothetical protein